MKCTCVLPVVALYTNTKEPILEISIFIRMLVSFRILICISVDIELLPIFRSNATMVEYVDDAGLGIGVVVDTGIDVVV